jgi:hypothetical protein
MIDKLEKARLMRTHKTAGRKQTLYAQSAKIAALRAEGKTVYEICKIVFGDDDILSMSAMAKHIDAFPTRRLRCRFG